MLKAVPQKKSFRFTGRTYLFTYILFYLLNLNLNLIPLPHNHDREHATFLCIVHIDEVFSASQSAQVKWKYLAIDKVLKFIITHFTAFAVYHLNLEVFVLVAVELQTEPAVVRVRPDADRFLEHIVTLLTIVHYYIGGPGCGTSKTIAYRVAHQVYSNTRRRC